MRHIWTLIRAVVYSTLFVAVVLVFVPVRVIGGFAAPPRVDTPQIAGMTMVAAGAALTASCVLLFVFVGRGTAAPFDPPRRLVARGPYRIVRNPIYVGAGVALAGAALYYRSLPLLYYLGLLAVVVHLLVVLYEEPTLRRSFGAEYDAYCRRVGRWWPTF